MAETTTISLEEGSDSSSLVESLDTTDNGTASQAQAAEDAQTLRARIADLEAKNAQYLRERNGWESQSRRNLETNQALTERLARIEGRLESTPQQQSGTSQQPVRPKLTKGQFKSALQSWVTSTDGGDAQLDQIEDFLLNLTPAEQAQARQLDPEELKRIVREELVDLGTKANLQSVIQTRYPDMANPQSDFAQAVWNTYDAFEADPQNQLLYPKDPRAETLMRLPDGSQRMVNVRLMDRLCAELRTQHATQEGRRQEQAAAQIGNTQTGNGRTTSSQKRPVEAQDLLTPGERAYLADPKVQKGWRTLPKDPKAAAKFFFDGLDPTEKQRRINQYRSTGTVALPSAVQTG